MSAEPEWVEEFLFYLRRTVRNGRVNVRKSADMAGVLRMTLYRFRSAPGGERLRKEWDLIALRARRSHVSRMNLLLHSRQ